MQRLMGSGHALRRFCRGRGKRIRKPQGKITYSSGYQSAALLAAIKEYEASKWKVIGAKVGKPAKVREALSSCQWRDSANGICRLVNNTPRNTLEAGLDRAYPNSKVDDFSTPVSTRYEAPK